MLMQVEMATGRTQKRDECLVITFTLQARGDCSPSSFPGDFLENNDLGSSEHWLQVQPPNYLIFTSIHQCGLR